jgi:hypothetical protein
MLVLRMAGETMHNTAFYNSVNILTLVSLHLFNT